MLSLISIEIYLFEKQLNQDLNGVNLFISGSDNNNRDVSQF